MRKKMFLVIGVIAITLATAVAQQNTKELQKAEKWIEKNIFANMELGWSSLGWTPYDIPGYNPLEETNIIQVSDIKTLTDLMKFGEEEYARKMPLGKIGDKVDNLILCTIDWLNITFELSFRETERGDVYRHLLITVEVDLGNKRIVYRNSKDILLDINAESKSLQLVEKDFFNKTNKESWISNKQTEGNMKEFAFLFK